MKDDFYNYFISPPHDTPSGGIMILFARSTYQVKISAISDFSKSDTDQQ